METIGSLLTDRPLYTIASNRTVRESSEVMAEKNVGALPVVDGERLVGIFSERDVITRVIAKGLDPNTTPIADIMTKDLLVASVDDDVDTCRTKMQQAHCRHLPVVSGERLMGFISLRDILQKDLLQKTEDLEYLKTYMFTVSPGQQKS